jgi:3-oxoacyl-[acyl-carrier protein] reductase
MSRLRVLITGGACGIGRATAERCRAEGYEVAVIDREGDGIRADLSDPAQTARALEEALSHGPITRLVNNVGLVRPGPVEAYHPSDFLAFGPPDVIGGDEP